MPVRRVLLVLLLLVPAAHAADKPAELRTLDGKTRTGELLKVSDKEIVFRTAGKEEEIPVEQVLSLDLGTVAKPSVKYIDVELTDGSLLHCDQVALKGKEATLTVVSHQQVTVPLDKISWLLNDAGDEKIQAAWKELLGKKRTSDLLVRLREGELATYKGTFGDADSEGKEIQFDLNSEGNPRAAKLEKIHGMIFYREPDTKAPPVVCKFLDTQGDVIMASAVSGTPEGFSVTTPAGVKMDYTRPLVARLDYSRDKLVYLSDLEPAKIVYSSTEDKPEPYRRDRNLDDTPGFRLARAAYNKGLALHSTTQLEFDLGGEYREFQAYLGVDERVGGTDGVTKIRIEGDGKELFTADVIRERSETKIKLPDDKNVYSSTHPDGKEEGYAPYPLRINLNIKDVQRLRIVVSPGGLLDLGRHLDLADAKVSK